jgi:hypothetical protein
MRRNDLGMAIVKCAWNPEAKDLAGDLSEIALDSLLDEGLLKEIPVIKTFLAALKTWAAIHDQVFLRKVANFLRACPTFTHEEREKFAKENLNDPKKMKRLGDALVIILDRLDDLEKPEMLAKAFAAHVRGKIAQETFRRLAAAIDIGFLDDLRALAADSALPPKYNRQLLCNLVRTGLTEITGGDMLTPPQASRGNHYDLNQLGEVFIACMSGQNPVDSP